MVWCGEVVGLKWWWAELSGLEGVGLGVGEWGDAGGSLGGGSADER